MDILIRAANVDHADDLGTILVDTWKKAYQGLIPDEIINGLQIDEEARKFRNRISQLPPDRSVFIAEVEEPVKRGVGFCVCGPDRESEYENSGEIYALYVLPDYQGAGIGRSLVHTAARWLAEQGYQRIIIFVLRDNTPARRFYEVIGGRVEREKTIDIQGFIASEVGYGYELSAAGFQKMMPYKKMDKGSVED